ncbi:hypothetical protein [Nostoc foliaceum]|uniref:Uncharacterized protein n=1 Tax=Nostoc foliaceum FACHB-393 TaxID=2692915 RepID=A0ABR8IM75_9NOSO|nr:hypothetical protein [Nostoc foliaceum]MBD2651615.1 hypothetical protein [Nostoc foliaceum FACHB-393]
MNEYSGLNSWIAIVNQKLPHLSRPQAKVLAMWSFGIGMMLFPGSNNSSSVFSTTTR